TPSHPPINTALPEGISKNVLLGVVSKMSLEIKKGNSPLASCLLPHASISVRSIGIICTLLFLHGVQRLRYCRRQGLGIPEVEFSSFVYNLAIRLIVLRPPCFWQYPVGSSCFTLTAYYLQHKLSSGF